MNTAEKIIQKFDGQSALARALGKRPSMVQYWAKAGVIPAKWHSVLLKLAQEMHIDLAPQDFAPVDTYQKIPPGTSTPETTDSKPLPNAKYSGQLLLGEDAVEIPCYVLDDGQRVISRTGATDVLTGKKGGGNLENYIGVEALSGYIPKDLSGQLIDFTLEGVVNKTVRGMSAETFLEICKAYVRALEDGALQTDRQKEIAYKASLFMAACSKLGLIALIDEATGYQYERTEDALRMKLKVYLEDEMRKWERTFPDELWKEFGRLTRWQGTIHQRPKYWGKLVMELVYDYLDKDVSDWLRENAPKPRHGQNYHQWLSSQYGLKKLLEHIWMLIGMASACYSLPELKAKMAERYGRQPAQYTMYLPMQR